MASKNRWGDLLEDEEELPPSTTTGPDAKGVVTKVEYSRNEKGEVIKRTTKTRVIKIEKKVYKVRRGAQGSPACCWRQLLVMGHVLTSGYSATVIDGIVTKALMAGLYSAVHMKAQGGQASQLQVPRNQNPACSQGNAPTACLPVAAPLACRRPLTAVPAGPSLATRPPSARPTA